MTGSPTEAPHAADRARRREAARTRVTSAGPRQRRRRRRSSMFDAGQGPLFDPSSRRRSGSGSNGAPAFDLRSVCEQAKRFEAIETHSGHGRLVRERHRGMVEDADPVTGGKLWVYRKNERSSLRTERLAEVSRRMRARNNASVTARDQALLGHRAGKRLRRPVADQPAHRARKPQPCLKHEAESREHALFQVEIGVELPRRCTAALRLDRIEPSYRYNRYMITRPSATTAA